MHGHLKGDAQTYADWGVDYLKVTCLTCCPCPAELATASAMWLCL